MNDSSSFSHEDASTPQNLPIQQLIAEGSTCCTYRVRLHGKLHTKKQLRSQYAGQEQYKNLLDKEFEIGYQLDFPTLPRYISKGEDELGPYILMDYVDGIPLDEFLRDEPQWFRKKSHRKHFAQQLLETLSYLHSRQILHLDIKPQNILITRVGHELRLLDFGFSYSDAYNISTGHSPSYAAPEQLNGERPYDACTDLYSAGLVLKLVYRSNTSIVRKLTQPQRDQRYASADEALKALNSHSSIIWLSIATSLFLATGLGLFLFMGKRSEDVPVVAIDSINRPLVESVPTIQKNDSMPLPFAPPIVKKKEALPTDAFQSELRKKVDAEFDAFYASYSELTEENYDEVQQRYVAVVHGLSNSLPDLCRKYPEVTEREASNFLYKEIERGCSFYLHQVTALFGKPRSTSRTS